MIVGFGDKNTKHFHETGKIRKGMKLASNLKRVALRKLDMLNGAHTLNDLRTPPGNHLEELKGDLEGYHSIRINDQYRIIFQWSPQGPLEVEITDYH